MKRKTVWYVITAVILTALALSGCKERGIESMLRNDRKDQPEEITEEIVETQKYVTRYECVVEIMRGLIDPEKCATYYYYDGFPLGDISIADENYVYFEQAYQNDVIYGDYEITAEEAKRLQKEAEHSINPAYAVFQKNTTVSTYYEEGTPVTFKLLYGQIRSGLQFGAAKFVTAEECVAYMARCIKEDPSFKDLNATWKYGKEIGLITESDTFCTVPESFLTRDDFDVLLERFSNCTIERDWDLLCSGRR